MSGLQIFGAVLMVVNAVVFAAYPNGWSLSSGLIGFIIILRNRS